MSVWGGIGEGLTAGMNARIALEEQRRREAQAQANADRQFAFQKEQAERAQANADRAYKAGREDAANAQSNANRTFTEGVRRADMAQANADRDFGLKLDMAQIGTDQAERELALKEQSASWEDKLNAERERQFKLQNDQLEEKWRKQKEEQDMIRATGRNQLAHGVYLLMANGNMYEQTKVNIGNETFSARVMPQSIRDELFGKEGPLSDIQNMFVVDTNDGKKIAMQKNTPNGVQTIVYSDDEVYDILHDGISANIADSAMRNYKARRDAGIQMNMERFKTDEAIRRDNASGLIGRRSVDALQSILKAAENGLIDLSDEQKKMVTDMIPQIASSYSMANANAGARAGTGTGRVQTPEEAARARAALEQKKAAQKRITAPTAKKKTEQKVEPKKEAAKQTEEKKEEPKKSPIPVQRKRRHGSETSSGSAFEINEEAVAARRKREEEEEEKRNRDREDFYRRMNSGTSVAPVGKRHN